MTARDHDAVFQALADPTRRTLLRALSASGPSTLAELSSGVPVSRQAVSTLVRAPSAVIRRAVAP